MIRIYKISGRRIDTCLAEPQWRESIRKLLCTQCRNGLRPEHVETDPNMEILFESKSAILRAPEAFVGRLKTGVPWKLVRKDLAEALDLREQQFKLFPVKVNGEMLTEYYCYSQPFQARLINISSYVQSTYFCEGCGALKAHIDYEVPTQIWGASLRDPMSDFLNPTWSERMVYTSSIGWGFFAKQEVVDNIPPSLRKVLKITECQIIDFPKE